MSSVVAYTSSVKIGALMTLLVTPKETTLFFYEQENNGVILINSRKMHNTRKTTLFQQ